MFRSWYGVKRPYASPPARPSHDPRRRARRFGAVYRGTWRAQEVAVKKLFVESSGHASPEQITELENEVRPGGGGL